MRVRMNRTIKDVWDERGVFSDYEMGKTYDLPEALAEVLINNGTAREDKSLDIPEVK